jgi:hypothetical protein
VSADSQLVTYLVRMVVPMRREFGVALDVQQFVRDAAYATAVLDKARGSADPRLREYAEGIEQRMLLGPRVANGVTPPAPPTQPAPLAEPASEAELRARMMKKYTTGLR